MIQLGRRLPGALLACALTAGVVLASSVPASAVTGGKDDTHGAFPSVGMIAFYADDELYRCSATLIAPQVLLTAAHCASGTDGRTAVTFESVVAEQGPSPLPEATDPAAGYTGAEAWPAGYVFGRAVPHPRYSGFSDLRTWNDVGVVVLDSPVAISRARLAPLGSLDEIPQRAFTKTLFTMVGYGAEVRQSETGPRRPTPMTYPLRRQYVESPGQRLTPQVFQVNGNDKDPFGGGGTCFGDSGGPALLGGEVVGVTSYAFNGSCRYLAGYQRVDIPLVRDWLARFLP
jgi:hypothetical protein